jgi:hypothetical protein
LTGVNRPISSSSESDSPADTVFPSATSTRPLSDTSPDQSCLHTCSDERRSGRPDSNEPPSRSPNVSDATVANIPVAQDSLAAPFISPIGFTVSSAVSRESRDSFKTGKVQRVVNRQSKLARLSAATGAGSSSLGNSTVATDGISHFSEDRTAATGDTNSLSADSNAATGVPSSVTSVSSSQLTLSALATSQVSSGSAIDHPSRPSSTSSGTSLGKPSGFCP